MHRPLSQTKSTRTALRFQHGVATVFSIWSWNGDSRVENISKADAMAHKQDKQAIAVCMLVIRCGKEWRKINTSSLLLVFSYDGYYYHWYHPYCCYYWYCYSDYHPYHDIMIYGVALFASSSWNQGNMFLLLGLRRAVWGRHAIVVVTGSCLGDYNAEC